MRVIDTRSVDVAGPLRRWARGLSGVEAAVELLLRACDGQLADACWPWVRIDAGCVWLDADQIAAHARGLSEPDQRVLAIVETLASGRPIGRLADQLADLDRATLRLVLAAFAHAGGSHLHTAVESGGDGSLHWLRLGPLVDWSEP